MQVDFKELESLRDEFRCMKDEDLAAIERLSKQNNVVIDVDKFRKIDYIIRMSFFRESDNVQEEIPFYFAHWYMSMVTLDILTKSVVEILSNLVRYYTLYMNSSAAMSEKKINFNYFIRTWQDFYGYLVNIHQTIYDYYDLFVRTCNLIDPNNKENPYYAYKSDIAPNELHAAVKELLLHGNTGRLAGFALLRSMIEISVIREILDLTKSNKYKEKAMVFKNDYPVSVNAICNALERLGHEDLFKTDTIIRLYKWQSKVAHIGFRADDYLTWFVRNITGQLCNLFYKNIQIYRDDVIQNLVDTAQIELKDKTS